MNESEYATVASELQLCVRQTFIVRLVEERGSRGAVDPNMHLSGEPLNLHPAIWSMQHERRLRLQTLSWVVGLGPTPFLDNHRAGDADGDLRVSPWTASSPKSGSRGMWVRA